MDVGRWPGDVGRDGDSTLAPKDTRAGPGAKSTPYRERATPVGRLDPLLSLVN